MYFKRMRKRDIYSQTTRLVKVSRPDMENVAKSGYVLSCAIPVKLASTVTAGAIEHIVHIPKRVVV